MKSEIAHPTSARLPSSITAVSHGVTAPPLGAGLLLAQPPAHRPRAHRAPLGGQAHVGGRESPGVAQRRQPGQRR